jgi:hypothetical protein
MTLATPTRGDSSYENHVAPVGGVLLLCGASATMNAAEPEWNPANNQDCDRAYLVQIMDRYMDALFKHDPKAVPPLSIDVRMAENTGVMNVGEGVLWRFRTAPTGFKIYVADPVNGQVALQTRLKTAGGRGRKASSFTTATTSMPPRFRC